MERAVSNLRTTVSLSKGYQHLSRWISTEGNALLEEPTGGRGLIVETIIEPVIIGFQTRQARGALDSRIDVSATGRGKVKFENLPSHRVKLRAVARTKLICGQRYGITVSRI